MDGKKILIFEFGSLVMCGERHPTMPVQGQSFVLIEPLFLEIGSKNMTLALAFEALHAWGLQGLAFEWAWS